MGRHRLRRDIIATVLANVIVDKAGPTFASRILIALDGDVAALVAAFETASQVFRLQDAWREVDALDDRIPAAAQIALYRELAQVLRGQTYWLGRRAERGEGGVQALIDTYRPVVDVMQDRGPDLLSTFERGAVEARCRAFAEAGAPEGLARRIALLRALGGATGIADLARELDWPAEAMARLYNAAGSVLGYDRLRAAAAEVRAADGFERAALRGLIVELIDAQLRRTREIARQPDASPQDPAAAVTHWTEARSDAVERALHTREDIEQTAGGWTFAKLTIANAALRAVG